MKYEYIVTAQIGAAYIQIGSFSERENAQEYINALLKNPPNHLKAGPEGEDVILDMERRPII